VDVGLKAEGRIPMKEFGPDGELEIKTGDTVDVFVERMVNVLARFADASAKQVPILLRKAEAVQQYLDQR